MKLQETICTVIGVVGAAIATALGGWDLSVKALVLFMAIDYISGIAVAGIFKNSTKTKTGSLESVAGAKGLAKKSMIFLFIIIGHYLDLLLGSNYIRDAVCIGFIINETISIVENAGLMGIPLPSVIEKSIDVLKAKEKDGE